jgi:hypothetical protein
MTFKAVFPDILARDRSGQGRPFGQRSGFGLQHTDFADLCQRFTPLKGRRVDGCKCGGGRLCGTPVNLI